MKGLSHKTISRSISRGSNRACAGSCCRCMHTSAISRHGTVLLTVLCLLKTFYLSHLKLIDSYVTWRAAFSRILCVLGGYVFYQYIAIQPSTQQLFINMWGTTCFDPNGPSSGAARLTHSTTELQRAYSHLHTHGSKKATFYVYK
jgi:hypothetical protein